MSFTKEQRAELAKPLSPDNVTTFGSNAGTKAGLSYVQGWKVKAELNRIFGNGGWSYHVQDLSLLGQWDGKDRRGNPQVTVSYGCRVLLLIFSGSGVVEREDVGHGHGYGKPWSIGEGHESAAKEAVTDALKRAASSLGWCFGLALYDKAQEHVGYTPEEGQSDPSSQEPPQGASAASEPKKEPSPEDEAKSRHARVMGRLKAGYDRMEAEGLGEPPWEYVSLHSRPTQELDGLLEELKALYAKRLAEKKGTGS